jgi:hypothetical protein
MKENQGLLRTAWFRRAETLRLLGRVGTTNSAESIRRSK